MLPKRHPLVKLIVFHYHELSRQFGFNFVQAQSHKMFWIVNGQSAVRFDLKDCFHCPLRRVKVDQQIISPLPVERTAIGRCFSVLGIDFFWSRMGSNTFCSFFKPKKSEGTNVFFLVLVQEHFILRFVIRLVRIHFCVLSSVLFTAQVTRLSKFGVTKALILWGRKIKYHRLPVFRN